MYLRLNLLRRQRQRSRLDFCKKRLIRTAEGACACAFVHIVAIAGGVVGVGVRQTFKKYIVAKLWGGFFCMRNCAKLNKYVLEKY
jgi:hypothetical protein